jgi:glycosyltransferase involved in cell wall biosynthesis
MTHMSYRPKIIFPFVGETKGGSLHSTLLLMQELAGRDIDAQAICHGNGYALEEAHRCGVSVTLIPGFGGAKENRDRSDGLRVANILSMRRAAEVLRQERPALIHINEKRMIRTWALPARMAKTPVLVHWRSNYTPSFSVDLGLRMAQRIVSISQYSSQALPAWARQKNVVVYNPVKTVSDAQSRRRSRAEKRQALGLGDDETLIGCFTNFSARKRPHLFLEIMQRLRQTRCDKIVGLLCGDVTPPADERFLKMVETEDWSGRVFMPGYVHDAMDWMAACDIILAPALSEPWGRTLAEAQSLGIPVVAAADGGHLESIKNGMDGFLASSDSPDDWIRVVGTLIDDAQTRASIVKEGYRSAAALSLGRHAEAIIEVYRDILECR